MIFDTIDNYFKEKKPTQIALTWLIIVAIIGFFTYTYLIPPSLHYLRENQNNLNSITQKLDDEKNYLTNIKIDNDQHFYTKKLQKEIVQKKHELVRAKKLNSYTDNKFKELSYLLSENKNWVNFLDRVSALGEKYNLKIIEISNEFNKPKLQKIEQILNIHVKTHGNYTSTIKFINALEESKLLVDMYKIDMESNQSISSIMDIALWGMRY